MNLCSIAWGAGNVLHNIFLYVSVSCVTGRKFRNEVTKDEKQN